MAPARRGRAWWALVVAAGAGALLLLVVAANSLARYRGWTTPKLAAAALSEKLAPYYRVMAPAGEGPFPTALLFSGCDGPRDNLERWGRMLNAQGWAAIVVDSHGPRGFSGTEIWRLICAGQLLAGAERAGDVLVSIDDARRMPFVDPERIALVGSSHGGWAIMDLLAFDPPARLPFNLASLRPDAPLDPLAGVVGVILLYPYCGRANRARPDGWPRPIPTLFLLSADDIVAPSGRCLEIADAMRAREMPVETVIFEGVNHAFDQSDRSPFSPLEFDEAATAEALNAGADFLERIGAP